MSKSKLYFFSLIVVITAFLLSACNEKDRFDIPGSYMNFMINVNTDAEFISLQVAGNSKEIFYNTVGASSLGYDNNGLIVYNHGGGFYVFDKTCTYDFPESVAVDLNGSKAVCPKCGSVFILPSIGAPAEGGLARHSLKEYRNSFNPNTGTLHVYN